LAQQTAADFPDPVPVLYKLKLMTSDDKVVLNTN